MQLSDKATAFLAQNPTIICKINGITYYEHPKFGDEVPLFYIDNGKLRESQYWDMESVYDGEAF